MNTTDSPYIGFLKKTLVFSLILGLITFVLGFLVPKNFITPALPFLFIFFIAITLTGYYLLIKSAKRQFIKFLNSYLLITTVKLLLLIGILVSYIMLNKKDAAPFGISFFILYVIYSVYEVVSLVGYSRSLKQ